MTDFARHVYIFQIFLLFYKKGVLPSFIPAVDKPNENYRGKAVYVSSYP